MIDDQPEQRMTPELKTALIAHGCVRLKNASTRAEQERVLAELAELIREPTKTFFLED